MTKASVVAAALLAFLLCLSAHVHSEEVDLSNEVTCPGVVPPPPDNRVCYKTTIVNPFGVGPGLTQCTSVTEISESNFAIEEKGTPPQRKIWSPRNLRGKNYQKRRLCRYHAVCPDGMVMHYSSVPGVDFELEPQHPGDGGEDDVCLDHVLIQKSVGSDQVLCGKDGVSTETTAPLKVEFRSNTHKQYPGFKMGLLCVLLQESKPRNCRKLNVSRKTRKRPQTITTYTLPRTGSKLYVPRGAVIRYSKNTIWIRYRKRFRRFYRIRKLFFATGFNGTKLFVRHAPRGALYGGGDLRVYRSYGIAYYSTDQIPPQFEPNDAEREVIGILLNATTPFFLDPEDNDNDIGSGIGRPGVNPPTSRPNNYQYVPPYRTFARPLANNRIDPRIDIRALRLAETFRFACNDFLRGAARSYLSILDELGIRPGRGPK